MMSILCIYGGMYVPELDSQSAVQPVLHLGSCTGLAKKHCASILAVCKTWGDLKWLVHLMGTKDAKQASCDH